MAKARPSEFGAVFARLRSILQKYAGRLSVTEDSARRFCLEGVPGPAALRAWGGKPRRSTLPVAWAEIGESYVSYHLMGIDGNSTVRDALSKELKARMQGKTCFNFKTEDAVLFSELEHVTSRVMAQFKAAGFIADP